MLIDSKYSLGQTIWFLANSSLHCNHIMAIDTYSDEKGVSVAYRTNIVVDGKEVLVCVNELNAFSSKEELINTVTERFYKSLEPGSS